MMFAGKMGRGRRVDEYIEGAKEGRRAKATGVEKDGFGIEHSRDGDGFEKAQLLA